MVGSDKESAVRDLADGAVEVGVAADDLCVSVQSLSSAQCRMAVLPAAVTGWGYFTFCLLMHVCMCVCMYEFGPYEYMLVVHTLLQVVGYVNTMYV